MKDSLHFIMDMADPEYVYWVESRTKAVYLHASPIDVSSDLKRLLFGKIKRTVLTSATLSIDGSFDYIKSRLGLESPTELVLQSHFDYGSQAMIYIPTHLPDPQSEEFTIRAAEEIERIVTVSRGRAFILFTSYKNLDQIHRLLQGKIPYQILRQGERSKTALLTEFKRDIHSILLATSSFWEGVDVQGDALSCVIIDRLPFAVPSEPLVEARIDYLRQEGENPFLSYQIPHAIITLRQGVGRLIRSREDRGLLCILDRRLLTRPYGRIFLQNLPKCPVCTDLGKVYIF
jgi:ATP-dependent DNA helicase DinG